ncbi:MAG TPA: CBS domain-containing protein [Natrialbaceae archaeon]|nr:CBS domain-containing protein [Natrialbaceae archaeon]
MNVVDAMTPRSDVVTVSLPGTRDDALEYLQEKSFSSVPVVKEVDDKEEFRGLLTRDSLIEDPDEDQLAILMDDDVPTTTCATSVEEAARIMVEQGARRLPVVDGELEGIITVTDIVRAIANGDVGPDVTVENVASSTVNATYSGTPLPVVERELYYADAPYAVVLDDEAELAGMVTEVDIIHVARVVQGEESTGDSIANQDDEWMWEGIKAVGSRSIPTRNVQIPNGPVSEFMTEDVVSITRRKSIKEAAQLMISNDIEQLPLVGGDQLEAIVLDVNLLEALYD